MGDEGKALHSQHKYRLPDWFIAGNVKTKAEHRTGILLLKSNGALGKRSKCSTHACRDGKRNCETGEDKPEAVYEYEFQENLYAEFRDLATAALLSKSSLPGKKQYDVKPWMAVEAGSSVCATAIIQHLARDMGTTCISVGPEDLYNLARDFHQQDQLAEQFKVCSTDTASVCQSAMKKASPSTTKPGDDSSAAECAILEDRDCMVKYQFAASPISRSHNSINTIMDAHLAKAAQQPLSPDNFQDILEQGSPVILHLRGAFEIYEISKKVIANFKKAVLDRWNKNEPVLLIASDCGYYAASELNIRSSLTMNFDRPMSPKQKIISQTENNQLQVAKMVRELKKSLRHRVPKGFASELLSDATRMDISDDLVKTGLPSHGDYDRVANQILGRACVKGTLELSDIHEVLTRAKHEKPKGDTSSENESLEVKELSFSERLEMIREDCTEYEELLLERVVDPETQKVTYDDVILEQSVKEYMRQLVHISKYRFEGSSKILLENTRITGALLYGPPGTGKTHLARAIANDTKATMLSISPADIMSKWIGETEKFIQAAFDLAKKLAPCVLFIDEVDALFYRRSSEDKSWDRKALTQFLQEMDGLSTGENMPFVLSATNRPMDLDEAFLRRLPKKIMFGLPGEEERLRILQIFLKESDLDPQVSLKALARKTEGFSGSDLRSLCGQAALHFAIDAALSRTPDDETRPVVKLQLKAKHFIEALRNVQPSVSSRSQEDTEAFNRLFNCGASKRARSDEDTTDNETAFL